MQANDWSRVLISYRSPILSRAVFELTVTLLPFAALWALAWAALSVSTMLAVSFALVNAGFLLRIFMIQHDCGHGSFLKNRQAGDWIGRVLGVLTLTPYDVWRKNHATHHATSGNLDRRGTGDIPTLTVQDRAGGPRLVALLPFGAEAEQPQPTPVLDPGNREGSIADDPAA